MSGVLTVRWLDVVSVSGASGAFRAAFKSAVRQARGVTKLSEDDGSADRVDLLFAGFVVSAYPQIVANRILERRLAVLAQDVGELVVLCYGRTRPMPSEDAVADLVTDQSIQILGELTSHRHPSPEALEEWCLDKIVQVARDRQVEFEQDDGRTSDETSWVSKL